MSELQYIDGNISARLLEYDKRFEQYGSDFTFYDYNHPEEIPAALKHAFKVVVADPPYLVRTKNLDVICLFIFWLLIYLV